MTQPTLAEAYFPGEPPEAVRTVLLRTLWECGGSTTRATSALGMARRMDLWRLLRQHDLEAAPPQIRRCVRARFRISVPDAPVDPQFRRPPCT